MSDPPTNARADLAAALAMEIDATTEDAMPVPATVHARVHDGFDVFGIPHGGYLAALAARSILMSSGQPDLFTVTVHYLRKAVAGPMDLQVARIGGSRRLVTWHTTGTQDGHVVLTALASVGDRTGIDGPSWTDVAAWDPDGEQLSARAGDPDLPFTAPRVAERFGQRIAMTTAGFAMGRRGDRAWMRAIVDTQDVDQLTAIVACDITPPAAWNALGPKGWVPTVELTAHVRARPAPGPLSVEVATHHVQHGFLDEDALVRDATGRLIVQSRQLARWTSD